MGGGGGGGILQLMTIPADICELWDTGLNSSDC